MAAGQLAGGLAWLAISGEDAPELVATAPVTPEAVMRAKIEAVIGAVAVPVMPFLVALAFASPRIALITMVGVALAAASSTAIQIFFRLAGAPFLFPPPPDLVARRDLRGGPVLDQLGGDRGPCRRRHLALHPLRPDLGRHRRRRQDDRPEAGRVGHRASMHGGFHPARLACMTGAQTGQGRNLA